jgi:transcription elongation factor S-II
MPPKRATTAAILTTITINTKGDVKKANLQHNESGEITLETIQKYFRKKDLPEEIARYAYNDRQFVVIGYKKGKAGTENKYDLPAPFAKQPKFGDLIVLQINEGQNWTDNALPMTPEQWKDFVENEADDSDESDDGKVADDDDEDEDEALFDEEEEEADADGDGEDDADGDNESDNGDGSGDDESDEEGGGDGDAEGDEEDGGGGGGGADDDIEPEPHVTRRRKQAAPAIKLADINAFREEVDPDAPPSSHPIRTGTLSQFQFLGENGMAEDTVLSLEVAIFHSAIEKAKRMCIPRSWKSTHFQEFYKQSARQILWNLHPRSPVRNPRLLERVLEGEFPVEQLAVMTAYDMYPEHWRELAEKQLVREQKILEGNKSRATDQYKCHRCGKRECTYYEMQTRSADEPMTIFITCINCGKQWRN